MTDYLAAGEVEATFLKTAVRNANLLALLSESSDDQELVEETLKRLHTHEQERLRGFRLAEALNPFKAFNGDGEENATAAGHATVDIIPPAEYAMLKTILRSKLQDPAIDTPARATFVEAISIHQNVYGVWHSSKYRDSRVVFRREGNTLAGIIQKIFIHHHPLPLRQRLTGHYVLVSVFEAIDGEDRFRRYGDAGGFCCKPQSTSKVLIPLQSIISHAAFTEIPDEDLIHVLPLNRVSCSEYFVRFDSCSLTNVQSLLSFDASLLEEQPPAA